MKIKKSFIRLSAISLIALMVITMLSPVSAGAKQTTVVKPTKVAPVAKKVSVKEGDVFELKAKMTPSFAEDDYLVWSIKKGKGVIVFKDNDRTGDDADFIAKKKGSAKVVVKIKGTKKKAVFLVTVNDKSGIVTTKEGKIKAADTLNQTEEIGDEFDLEVKKIGDVSASDLKWSVENTSIAKLSPDSGTGFEAEFIALKEGTTKITCTYTVTNQKVVYTVKVVPYEEDEDDDEEDDDYDDDYDDEDED